VANWTELDNLPSCDYCREKAQYDSKTIAGSWAYLCPEHWSIYSYGMLGENIGYRLYLKARIDWGDDHKPPKRRPDTDEEHLCKDDLLDRFNAGDWIEMIRHRGKTYDDLVSQ